MKQRLEEVKGNLGNAKRDDELRKDCVDLGFGSKDRNVLLDNS